MLAEQIPGSLFVLLIALAAFMNEDTDVVFILAIACAIGWVAMGWGTQNAILGKWSYFLSIGLFAVAALLLLTRIFL